MDLNLDHVLQATRKGQWSVDEFDWSRPLEGASGISKRELREMGLIIVFTAGLERQAAKIFDACASYVTDERAREIYKLFAIDEDRHADAELKLARRYGVGWEDLPLATRAFFAQLNHNWRTNRRLLHEFSSAQIILFEFGLDSLLIPALKEAVNDPLQAEVFRRIDLDESRHLAMDYWLLDRKGSGIDHEPLRPSAKDLPWLLPTMMLMPVAFRQAFTAARTMQRRMHVPERLEHFWRRVEGVTSKSPAAANLEAFTQGVRMQEAFQRLAGGEPVPWGAIARRIGRRALRAVA